VVIPTNRWKPGNCMWIVEKAILPQNACIVFPFPELWQSVCHIIVGTSERYKCFIHLTPLTSLFRTSTDELSKIILNLSDITHDKPGWEFEIFYFHDDGCEAKFRELLLQVLGDSRVSFFPLHPKGYKKGELHLFYYAGALYYSLQHTEAIAVNHDISHIGLFNTIPIYAYE
jgi:hypothetical protein